MVIEFFPEEKVSEVRERASILEVVSDYVKLKKTGKNHKGLCPFHSEKTPSFMVNEEKQIFHCFGCGEGGDVFTFLMKMANFSFPQAVEELAKRYGVRGVIREPSPERKREVAKKEVLFQINQLASEYFHDLLLKRREAEVARKYLAHRGISREVIQEYRLGYALDLWDGLVQHLHTHKVPLELARELGLVLPKRKEGWYDTFRGRVIFPIFDLQRRPVGFGGRLLKEGEPKYLNSSESSIYHKGEILYGLQVAKQHIGEKNGVLIVEGYFDLLTLHQFGIKHCVATLGTALTPQHIRTLKRYTENLITVFDGDQAGIQANLRALPLFLEEGVWAKTVILPKGDDPDELLRKGRLDEFEKRMAQAIPLFDFFLESLGKTYDLNSMNGRVKVAEEGIALIRRIPEGIRRNFYIRALAEKVDIQEGPLYEMLRSAGRDRGQTEREVQGPGPEKHFPKTEEMMVRLMIQHPELIPQIEKEGVVRDFENPILKGIAEGLEALYQRRGRLELAEALTLFEGELQSQLRILAFQESELEGGQHEKILRDCIQKIHEWKLKKDKGKLLQRIKEAEKQRGGAGLEALLLERQELVKREGSLRKSNL